MLYEGVSARPTTISLAEVRESVSGQPMSAAGPNPEVRQCDREVGFTPQERTFLRTAASRQNRTVLKCGF